MKKTILEHEKNGIKIEIVEETSIYNNSVSYTSFLSDYKTGTFQKRKIKTLKKAYWFFDFITKGARKS